MTHVRIKAEAMPASELQPGDMFSTAGPEYWDFFHEKVSSCGERVYLRTNASSVNFPDADTQVYRITPIKEVNRDVKIPVHVLMEVKRGLELGIERCEVNDYEGEEQEFMEDLAGIRDLLTEYLI